MVLILKRKDFMKLVRHAEDTKPIEACGILAGKIVNDKKFVKKVYPTKNILNSESRYQVDPEEQIKIFTETEKKSLDIIGFYHSHPHWSTAPSEIDKSSAFYPNHSYLIYSISNKKIESYIWNGKNFEKEDILIT
jgi:proteasome lid subunit RPN8/RPN11